MATKETRDDDVYGDESELTWKPRRGPISNHMIGVTSLTPKQNEKLGKEGLLSSKTTWFWCFVHFWKGAGFRESAARAEKVSLKVFCAMGVIDSHGHHVPARAGWWSAESWVETMTKCLIWTMGHGMTPLLFFNEKLMFCGREEWRAEDQR